MFLDKYFLIVLSNLKSMLSYIKLKEYMNILNSGDCHHLQVRKITFSIIFPNYKILPIDTISLVMELI